MTRDQSSQWLLYGLIAVCAALIVYWYLNLEWEEKEIDMGPSDEARRNPYLALQMYAESQGLQSHFQRGFSGLADLSLGDQSIGKSDTLVLIHTYQGLADHHLEAVWAWVEQGGNLIVTAENPFVNPSSLLSDTLMERLNLTLETDYEYDLGDLFGDEEEEEQESEEPSDESVATEEEAPWQPSCLWQDSTEINWGDHTPPLTISDDYYARLYDTDAYYDDDESAAFALKTFNIGNGNIHVFASDIGLRNDSVGCEDNGFLFWQMVKESPKVWFAVNANSPSFWQELWRLSAVGCVSLLLALAFWVWQQGTRFGPIYLIDRSQRRNFIDHIRASATFLLRNQNNQPLIQSLRDDITQRMHVKHSHFDRMTPQEQMDKFIQASAMTSEDIERAMFQPLPVPSNNFIGTVRRLQYLRNQL